LQAVRQGEVEQARGAAQGAGERGADVRRGAVQDRLSAGRGQQVGELGGMGADGVVGDVAQPAAAAGEIGDGGQSSP